MPNMLQILEPDEAEHVFLCNAFFFIVHLSPTDRVGSKDLKWFWWSLDILQITAHLVDLTIPIYPYLYFSFFISLLTLNL